MKRTALITAAVLILAGASCGKVSYKDDADTAIPDENPLTKIELDTRSEAFVEQGKTFAFNFIRRVNEVDEKSFIISPLSMQFLLGMILDGAQGGTADEICQVLGYEPGSIQAANAFASTMMEQLPAVDKTTTLSIGNAVFVNQSFTILDGFRSSVVQYYDAEVSNLDFADSESATGRINQWCADRTNGLIDHVLDQVDPATLAFLMNAVYFKSRWEDVFHKEATTKQPFHYADGHTADIDLMHTQYRALYVETDELQLSIKPFIDGAFQFVMILPKEGVDAAKAIPAAFSYDLCADWGSKTVDLELYLPKFTSEYKEEKLLPYMASINPSLKFLKDDITFIEGFEDDSALAAKQKTFIKIDEEGAEAAAVTDLKGLTEFLVPEHVDIRLDRPFFYAIVESNTQCPLFIGYYGN